MSFGLTLPRVFAKRLPYSAQYVDGVVGTLKGTHNLYQQKALARWVQLTLILTPKKSAVPPRVGGSNTAATGTGTRTSSDFNTVRVGYAKSLPVHDSGTLLTHVCPLVEIHD